MGIHLSDFQTIVSFELHEVLVASVTDLIVSESGGLRRTSGGMIALRRRISPHQPVDAGMTKRPPRRTLSHSKNLVSLLTGPVIQAKQLPTYRALADKW
jgi:hypothetical protein